MSNPTTKIAELVPNCKGQKPLVFEVSKIVEKSANGETAICRIVDETGVITAEFNQFVQYIVQGSVYQLTNFKCKVVNHHLRLEMTKASVMAKLPQALGFKDLENDLSAKFYVANQVAEPEKNGKKEEGKETNAMKKTQEGKKQQTEDKAKKQEKNEKKTEYKEKKEAVKEETKKEQQEPQKKYVEKKPETQKPKKHQEKVQPEADKKQPKKGKYVAKNRQIKLIDMPKYQQESVSFCVRVNLTTSIKKQKYFLCKVSDSTGSTYFQFQPKMSSHLQNKAWYKLIDFKIFADKEYGFIATQEAKSSYELIENIDEQPETKLLWR